MSELGLDKQNKGSLGRLLGSGSIGKAEEGPDGRMRATIRIPPDELVWEPSILVMPHGGDLDLEIINDDLNTHCAVLPSNGTRNSSGWSTTRAARPRSTSTARATTGSARAPATTRAAA